MTTIYIINEESINEVLCNEHLIVAGLATGDDVVKLLRKVLVNKAVKYRQFIRYYDVLSSGYHATCDLELNIFAKDCNGSNMVICANNEREVKKFIKRFIISNNKSRSLVKGMDKWRGDRNSLNKWMHENNVSTQDLYKKACTELAEQIKFCANSVNFEECTLEDKEIEW